MFRRFFGYMPQLLVEKEGFRISRIGENPNVSNGSKRAFGLTVAIGGSAAVVGWQSEFLLWGKNVLWATETEQHLCASPTLAMHSWVF